MKNFNPAPPTTPPGKGRENKKEISINFAVETVAHEDHPERNEDTVLKLEKLGVFGVFDGKGGSHGGQDASLLAVKSIEEYLNDNYKEGLPPSEMKAIFKEAFMGANSAIVMERKRKAELSDMGTTGSMVGVGVDETSKPYCVVAHIGDSRVYLWDQKGLEQITTDDDSIHYDSTNRPKLSENEKLEFSRVLSNATKSSDLNPKAQSYFERRNAITKYLGEKPEEESKVFIYPLEENSKILIMSDGIHDNLTTDGISEIISTSTTPEEAARRLKERALQVSRQLKSDGNIRPKLDDMTAVVIEINKS